MPSWLARQKYWMKRKILLKSISALSKGVFIWRKLAQLDGLSHLDKIIFVPRSLEKNCFDYAVLILFIGSQITVLTSFVINTVRFLDRLVLCTYTCLLEVRNIVKLDHCLNVILLTFRNWVLISWHSSHFYQHTRKMFKYLQNQQKKWKGEHMKCENVNITLKNLQYYFIAVGFPVSFKLVLKCRFLN